jgi:hypothetical protein
VDSLGGKTEEEKRCISFLSHENPVGFTRRKKGRREEMYPLLISRKSWWTHKEEKRRKRGISASAPNVTKTLLTL